MTSFLGRPVHKEWFNPYSTIAMFDVVSDNTLSKARQYGMPNVAKVHDVVREELPLGKALVYLVHAFHGILRRFTGTETLTTSCTFATFGIPYARPVYYRIQTCPEVS